MTNPNDNDKPGAFLELFPHLLSRLYLTLLWKINQEQDGDAVVLTNTWLREFARLDRKSLHKYRTYLHDCNIILSSPVGNGRQYLYRVANPQTSKPLNDNVTDEGAVKYLGDAEAKTAIVRQRVVKRWKRKANEMDPAEEPPSSQSSPSSWDNSGW
jgi:hypothetical protein